MGTIYTINSETAIDALADADELLVEDNSAGITKKVGADQVVEYVGSVLTNVTASTLTVTKAAHAGRVVTINAAAGCAVTLPAATGTGSVYKFVIGTTVTSNTTVIQVANATDEFVGVVIQVDADTSDTLAAYPALDADGFDTITMNGSTKGGIQGDFYTITDIASGKFLLEGYQSGTGTVATPLSAAVS